jgi:bisphosphoglycerate-independent phosphoglycerate mutase (AlkP superfamily)
MSRLLMIFVDGLGMGTDDPDVNPIHSGICPHLERLLTEHAVSIDASLGIEGLPQSATGTTTILTGINAAQIMKRHVEGFPKRQLKEIVQKHNIFWQLASRGLTSTFANAYFFDDMSEADQMRLQSVTTVATLSAFGRVRDRAMLERNEAVYQDLTRESLQARGYTGPLVSAAESAGHLVAIAQQYHFTLFEYFQTDRAGHSGDPAQVRRALSLYDEFLGALLPLVRKERMLFVMTSDHGNIEDIRIHTHTANLVPFVAVGPDEENLRRRVKSIADVTPVLLDWLSAGVERC